MDSLCAGPNPNPDPNPNPIPNPNPNQVLQLYLSYPAAAGEPPLVLRGYSKTAVLAPGETAEVRFKISRKELSIWSEEQMRGADVAPGGGGLRGGWQLVRLGLGLGFS